MTIRNHRFLSLILRSCFPRSVKFFPRLFHCFFNLWLTMLRLNPSHSHWPSMSPIPHPGFLLFVSNDVQGNPRWQTKRPKNTSVDCQSPTAKLCKCTSKWVHWSRRKWRRPIIGWNFRKWKGLKGSSKESLKPSSTKVLVVFQNS